MTNEEKLKELEELEAMLKKVTKKATKLICRLNAFECSRCDKYGSDLDLVYGRKDLDKGINQLNDYISKMQLETYRASVKEEKEEES